MNSRRDEAKRLASQPYLVRLHVDTSDESEILYVAENPELEGCSAQGLTPEDAETALSEVRVEYIEHLLEYGLAVPVAKSANDPKVTAKIRA